MYKKAHKKLWISIIAVFVIIAIVCGIFYYRFGSIIPLGAKVLASPVYPETAMYPAMDESFDFNNTEHIEKYNKWSENQKTRITQNKDYSEGLDGFLNSSIQTFLKSGKNNNVIFSPLNVYMALGLLAEITEGGSRQEILSVLGNENIESLRTQASKIWNYCYRKDGIAKLLLANSLWLDTSIDYKKETLDILAKNYYVSSYSGNMGSRDLNELYRNWINELTDNLLKDQISELSLSKETVFSIVSTVNFAAKWTCGFDKKDTDQGVFYSPSGNKNVSYMKGSFDERAYWGEKFTAVYLPLAQRDYGMTIILPDKQYTATELLEDSETMELILNRNEYENKKDILINATIPKFDINSTIDLESGLKEMGITDVFDKNASGISNLTDKDRLKFKAMHGARVIIDEEGCKAVSYVTMEEVGSRTPDEEMDFVVDRPFIFTISTSDGTPFFTGIVNNP